MKLTRTNVLALIAAGATLLCAGCGGQNNDLVESGTYEGVITEINPAAEEIYVTIGEETLELYFTEQTTLQKADESVPFSDLQNGQRVSVSVVREGDALRPVSVRILE